MHYSIEDLHKMSKDELVLLASQLLRELETNEPAKKTRAGVVTIGSPKYVRDYADAVKRRLIAERGGNE
jgi:hypothetical protein